MKTEQQIRQKLIILFSLAIFVLVGFCGCGQKVSSTDIFPTTTSTPPVIYKLVPLATMSANPNIPSAAYISEVMASNGDVFYSFYGQDSNDNIKLITIDANETLIIIDENNTADEFNSPVFESGQSNTGYWYSWALHISKGSIANNYFTVMPVNRDNGIYYYSTTVPK